MAILTKLQLQAANSASFPNNNSQQITPQILRDYNTSVIDTLVDSLDTGSFARTDLTNDFSATNNFTSISASSFISASAFIGDGSKLTNITASIALPILDEGILQGYATSMNFTGSAISAQVIAGTAVVQVNIDNVGLVTTASFNAFTASTNTFTSSANTSITNLNASSASQQVSINALNVYTSSQSSASVVNSITALNSFTQSQETFNSTISAEVTALEVATASLFTSVSNLNASSASQQISINALNQATQSLQSKTGSYATTGSNSFNGSQNITGSLTVTDGATSLQVGTSGDIISLNAGGNNINFTFGGDAAFAGDNITLRNASGEPSFALYNGTGVGQKVYGTKVTNTGASGSYVINDVQNNKDYITLGGAGENVVIGSPLSVSGNLTASLQQGYVWVGNASGISTTLSTSSFVTESETGSFARTDVNNIFTGVQTFQSISASGDIKGQYFQGDVNTYTIKDGIGTVSGVVAVSSSLSVTNAFSASLPQGYVWVGDNTNRTVLVATSSFATSVSGFVTTASFNSYTQSNDQRVSSLEAATSSYVTESETGSFARYDVSNPWSANQTFTNITAVSASFTYVQTLYETASVIYSSGSNQFGDELSDTQTLSGSVKVQGSLTVNGTPVLTSSVDISGLTTTASFNAYTQSNDSKVNSLINATASYATSAITASSLITASAVGNTITFTKGDASTFNVIVASTPIDTGSFATTASFNAYTSSNDAKVNSLIAATGSFVTTSSFNTYTSSQSTASLVTSITELNTFSASALISLSNLNTTTASLNTSVSNLNTFSSSTLVSLSNLNTATASLFTSTSLSLITASFDNGTRNLTFTKGDNQTFSVNIPDVSGSVGGFATLGANTFTGSQTISSSLSVSGSANFVGGDVNFTDQGRNINIDVDRTIIKGQKPTLISSSLDIQGSLTASLANGYAWVGDATNHNVLVATSSFATNVSNLATTGSNSFNGNQTITGSLILSSSNAIELQVIGNSVFTGSAFGNVVALSITSNTASMDLSLGNYFTLTLANTATTHISASNVQPGVSATLVITTGTNSSASLAPTMLQPSGSAYSATNGSSKKDVLSIVAVASGVPFVVSTKNMI